MQMKKQHLGCETMVEVADNSQDVPVEAVYYKISE